MYSTVKEAGRQSREAGSIIGGEIVTDITRIRCCGGRHIGVPICFGRQCLAGVMRITTSVFADTLQILFQENPFAVAGHVPTHRTDTLHSAGNGIAAGAAVHHGQPVVEISVFGDGINSLLGCVAAAFGRGRIHISAESDCRTIAEVLAAKVLLGPTLGANFHGVVLVAVVVGNFGGAADEVERSLRGTAEDSLSARASRL